MKKIVIAENIGRKLMKQNTFLNRSDIKVYTAGTLEAMLEIHRTVRADLIISHFDLLCMKPERFCSLVRQGAAAEKTAVLMVCPDRSAAAMKVKRCNADVVLYEPAGARKILGAARRILNLSWRETYRVLLNVEVEGTAGERSFSCHSLDISATGMLLETTQSFRAGERVTCAFLLPDATRIDASGEVVRVLPKLPGADTNLYGIRFKSVVVEAREALEALVRSLSPGPHGVLHT